MADKENGMLSRMISELEGLEEKFSKLDAFIMGEHYSALPADTRMDLCEQHRHMEGYVRVLKRKINKMMGVTIDV